MDLCVHERIIGLDDCELCQLDAAQKRVAELEAAHSKIFDLLIEVRGFQPRSPVCPALQEAIDTAATAACKTVDF